MIDEVMYIDTAPDSQQQQQSIRRLLSPDSQQQQSIRRLLSPDSQQQQQSIRRLLSPDGQQQQSIRRLLFKQRDEVNFAQPIAAEGSNDSIRQRNCVKTAVQIDGQVQSAHYCTQRGMLQG